MIEQDRTVLDDPVTRDAARRLVVFLKNERELLPVGHPWRRRYGRDLVRTVSLFPSDEEERVPGAH